jgi:hypothetical protein
MEVAATTRPQCDRTKYKLGDGRSLDSSGTGKKSTRETPPCLNTKNVRAKSITCPTVLTTVRTKQLLCCLSTRRKKMLTRRRQTSKFWAITKAKADNRDGHATCLTAEDLRIKVIVVIDILCRDNKAEGL